LRLSRARAKSEREYTAGCHQGRRDPQRPVEAADKGCLDGIQQVFGVGGGRRVRAGDGAFPRGSRHRGRDGMLELIAVGRVEDRAEDGRPERAADHAERLKDAGRDAAALAGHRAERRVDRRRKDEPEAESCQCDPGERLRIIGRDGRRRAEGERCREHSEPDGGNGSGADSRCDAIGERSADEHARDQGQ
jgi:hypothetical protein